VNWRAIGCGTLAAVVFVAVGLFSIWRAGAPARQMPMSPTATKTAAARVPQPMARQFMAA